MVAELAAIGAFLVAAIAELIHLGRVRRVARLAFGPGRHPSPWARSAPALRLLAIAATTWGLTALIFEKPMVHVAESLPDNQKRNVILILDVSPSMNLADAGPEKKQSRRKRAAALMESFFKRVPIEQYLTSVIACYNGSKPVVVGTKDLEVVRNILDDLPMNYAFVSGKTDIFSGLEEAFKAARPWNPKSTLVILLSDGDTVASTGMPKAPASVSDVLIVGVGDPRAGSFIEGHQSRQDVGTLRQLAARLNGTYHDGNEKQLPSELLSRLTLIPRKNVFERLTRREYALIACGLGASILAFLPAFLHRFGTTWTPGVGAVREIEGRSGSRNRKKKEFGVESGARVG